MRQRLDNLDLFRGIVGKTPDGSINGTSQARDD
jgi:hypothetical protein